MNEDIKFILYTIDDEYANSLEESDIDNLRINWTSVLRTALNNRILYIFSKSALIKYSSLSFKAKTVLETITKEGNKWLERFYNTLSLLEDYVGYQNFSVIKTFKFFQDVTFDVDIVLLDDLFEQINKLSKEADFGLSKINGGYELNPKNRNYLSVDVYENFLFEDESIGDKDFICNRSRMYKSVGDYYYIPSTEAELLLYISQVNFQNRFLTLQDFLQTTKIMSKEEIKWDNLLAEIMRHRWKKSFMETISIVNSLYMQLYVKRLDIPIEPHGESKCRFPYFLSPLSVLKYDFEVLGQSFSSQHLLKDLLYLVHEFHSFYVRKRIPIYQDWIDLNGLLTRTRFK